MAPRESVLMCYVFLYLPVNVEGNNYLRILKNACIKIPEGQTAIEPWKSVTFWPFVQRHTEHLAACFAHFLWILMEHQCFDGIFFLLPLLGFHLYNQIFFRWELQHFLLEQYPVMWKVNILFKMGSNMAQFAVLKLLISVSPPLRKGLLRTLALMHLPLRVVSLFPNTAVWTRNGCSKTAFCCELSNFWVAWSWLCSISASRWQLHTITCWLRAKSLFLRSNLFFGVTTNELGRLLQNFLNISNVAHASIEQAHMGIHKNRHTHKLKHSVSRRYSHFSICENADWNEKSCVCKSGDMSWKSSTKCKAAEKMQLLGDVILQKNVGKFCGQIL